MTKIVINICYGGFSVSETCARRIAEIKGIEFVGNRWHNYNNYKRDDLALIQAIEELGKAANGAHTSLKIVEVPEGSRYKIDEYDGNESLETPESIGWQIAGGIKDYSDPKTRPSGFYWVRDKEEPKIWTVVCWCADEYSTKYGHWALLGWDVTCFDDQFVEIGERICKEFVEKEEED